MVIDRYPELLALSVEDKWRLLIELEDQVMASDTTHNEPLKSEIISLLEERYAQYQKDPSSASSWADVSAKMKHRS